jgi:hypothetical protein
MGYIAQQYAKLLDEEDILKLFGKLEEAAVKCDLTDDWKTLKGEMKTSTKEKILEQLLEYLPLETMDYIIRKLFDSSSSLFVAYMTTLYEKALGTNDRSQFLELANSFEQTRDRYFGLISNKNEREIDDLTIILRKHSRRIGSTWEASSLKSKRQRLGMKTLDSDVNRRLFQEDWFRYADPNFNSSAASRIGQVSFGTKPRTEQLITSATSQRKSLNE